MTNFNVNVKEDISPAVFTPIKIYLTPHTTAHIFYGAPIGRCNEISIGDILREVARTQTNIHKMHWTNQFDSVKANVVNGLLGTNSIGTGALPS